MPLNHYKILKFLTDVVSKKDYWLLFGKTIDVGNREFDRCEDALGKCLKLDPNCVDGWTLLGEALWKKGDIPGAKRCFEKVLAKVVALIATLNRFLNFSLSSEFQERNPIALRCLSMCLRQNPPDGDKEKVENLMRSWDLSKEALELNPKDGRNHCIDGSLKKKIFINCH